MPRFVFKVFAAAIFLNCTPLIAAPFDEPSDPAMAINEPDKYAWILFVALNWPADVAQKKSDPSKAFGAQGTVVWETWRNARNEAPDTTFRLDGSDPGEWLSALTVALRTQADVDRQPVQQTMRRVLEPLFDQEVGQSNETRLNKETYEFIRKNVLYNIEGQEALVKKAEAISFPVNSKEIKAQWRKISEADKPRYHWVEIISNSGEKEIWGLTALHIITKDIPNWFWATFEHIDNKLPANQGGRRGNEGWQIKSKDKFSCPTPPHDCEQAPKGIGLENTKWQHYRLRGTQVDFIDIFGQSTILANSQPERRFQTTSSCMTCHARVTIGTRINNQPNANRLDVFKPDRTGYVGPPLPTWFANDGAGQRYIHLDFVWSLDRAVRAKQ